MLRTGFLLARNIIIFLFQRLLFFIFLNLFFAAYTAENRQRLWKLRLIGACDVYYTLTHTHTRTQNLNLAAVMAAAAAAVDAALVSVRRKATF